jgi:hypothetical protein
MAAAMTDHIQNNPFGRSTDGHRDDWSAVQIGGSAAFFRATPVTQRHTGERHHLEADLRSSPGRTCWSWCAIYGN